jgi:hypothetical protein
MKKNPDAAAKAYSRRALAKWNQARREKSRVLLLLIS